MSVDESEGDSEPLYGSVNLVLDRWRRSGSPVVETDVNKSQAAARSPLSLHARGGDWQSTVRGYRSAGMAGFLFEQ